MATTKRRINISLPAETEALVFSLARRDQVPAAAKVRELLEQSLGMIEDEILSTAAEKRLQSPTKQKVSHTTIWGE